MDTVRGIDSKKEIANKNYSGREEDVEEEEENLRRELRDKQVKERKRVFSFCFGCLVPSPSGCHLGLRLHHTAAHICGNANTCVTYEGAESQAKKERIRKHKDHSRLSQRTEEWTLAEWR